MTTSQVGWTGIQFLQGSVPEIVPYCRLTKLANSILDLGASQLVRTGVDLSGKITATADGGDKIGASLSSKATRRDDILR